MLLNCGPLDGPSPSDRCEIKCQNTPDPVQCYLKCNPAGSRGPDQDSEELSQRD